MTLTDPHISRHRGAQTCSATVKAPLLPSHDLDPSSPSKLPDLSVLLLEHLVSMSLLNPQSKDQKVFGQSSTKDLEPLLLEEEHSVSMALSCPP
ncbi:uncharacterized protein LOC131594755 isoform X2 [Vicia villosa]|uniref:uncharacterized protein LOC131594755 isoform X2 n=1 Tax=Vicia villosa TaxID=3911 RepID=UPI00273A9BDE|nr:uncharacterized protein LOC131594755 isoform X2 [Vicia villosa]